MEATKILTEKDWKDITLNCNACTSEFLHAAINAYQIQTKRRSLTIDAFRTLSRQSLVELALTCMRKTNTCNEQGTQIWIDPKGLFVIPTNKKMTNVETIHDWEAESWEDFFLLYLDAKPYNVNNSLTETADTFGANEVSIYIEQLVRTYGAAPEGMPFFVVRIDHAVGTMFKAALKLPNSTEEEGPDWPYFIALEGGLENWDEISLQKLKEIGHPLYRDPNNLNGIIRSIKQWKMWRVLAIRVARLSRLYHKIMHYFSNNG